MAPIDSWYKLRSKMLRALAVMAIIFAYGLGQAAVTGVMMSASTTSAQAWWRGRGWRGYRRGWGWRRGW